MIFDLFLDKGKNFNKNEGTISTIQNNLSEGSK